MIITGYSERGAINTLFYEIAYSGKALHLLKEFLALLDCPDFQQICKGLFNAHVLIEQSLSDFGDADVILLLDAGVDSAVVFFEVKVKSSQKKEWGLSQEFNNFKEGCGTERKLSSSNLFTQLYHKNQFINGLRSPDIGIKGLQKGIDFPPCSTKPTRKIGNNPVVLSAVHSIEPYQENAWYFSLVPDKSSAVCFFFEEFRKDAKWPLDSRCLENERWGGLAWEQVVEFCDKFEMESTKRVIEFNKGQIY